MAYFRLFLGVPKTAIFGRPRPGGEIPDFRKFFFFFFWSQGKIRVSGNPANPRSEIDFLRFCFSRSIIIDTPLSRREYATGFTPNHTRQRCDVAQR